ncbi:hypothetical protein Mucpa_3811 [Mucilaginibacter paludis DSM 18603]|uniref:Uncharacterized protein n=2 Tax=Mucilaginibacter TaxID=423349 RepID=H1Y2C7_9SPHI|nr:hypothetical protein Mucpa_3811 [Mucilaginibacter paludis DSM 18603]
MLIALMALCSVTFAQSGKKTAGSGLVSKSVNASKPTKKHRFVIIIRSYNNEYLADTTEKGKNFLKLINPLWVSRVDMIYPKGKTGLYVGGGMAITINDEKYPNALRILMPHLTKQ